MPRIMYTLIKQKNKWKKVKMLELLTSSHDRGWKPTVKPLKICGPGLSHEMESSIKTLKDNKIDMIFTYSKVTFNC